MIRQNKAFTAGDQETITLLKNTMNDEDMYRKFYPSYYYGPDWQDDREMSISPMFADELLKKLNHLSTCFNFGRESYQHVTVQQKALPFSIKLDKGQAAGFQMDVTELLSYQDLELYGYLCQGN